MMRWCFFTWDFTAFTISLSLKPLPLILPSAQPGSPGETPVHRSFMSYSGRVLPMVWWGPSTTRRVLSRTKFAVAKSLILHLHEIQFGVLSMKILYLCIHHGVLTCACFFNPLCFPSQKWIRCLSRRKTSTTEIFTHESKSGSWKDYQWSLDGFLEIYRGSSCRAWSFFHFRFPRSTFGEEV